MKGLESFLVLFALSKKVFLPSSSPRCPLLAFEASERGTQKNAFASVAERERERETELVREKKAPFFFIFATDAAHPEKGAPRPSTFFHFVFNTF